MISKKNFLVLSLALMVIFSNYVFAAKVIKKEDAAQYSKKNDFASVMTEEEVKQEKVQTNGQSQTTDAQLDKFSVTVAVKDGKKYTNKWSNYTITFDDNIKTANDYYDFAAEGSKYDFGVYFPDFSRLAVYYSKLARDINVVCAHFAPGVTPNDVIIAGETFKHVQYAESYPFGTQYYDYYLRPIDGKLMVIECFHEKDEDKAFQYIDKFLKAK